MRGHNHEVIMRGCECRLCKYLYGTFVVPHILVVGRSYMLTPVRITKYTFLQHVQYRQPHHTHTSSLL